MKTNICRALIICLASGILGALSVAPPVLGLTAADGYAEGARKGKQAAIEEQDDTEVEEEESGGSCG